ncbi:MAG: hypothetical protein CR986_04515 [Ignavibacteriae bacterium]|nr:MAG: hypothetical protein CR986_04515 [Ignavibacteriota bacterium]
MKEKKLSYLISTVLHLILILLFWVIKIGLEPVEDNYVTIGFGAIGKMSSSGVFAENPTDEVQKKQPEVQKEVSEKVVKKVELPKIENTDEQNNVVASADKKEAKEDTQPQKTEPLIKQDEAGKGKEDSGDSEGNYGFEIDFGGKGMRKIYSYSLPAYPDGVSKEIDVKLKFSILADGTVGKILPLIKADTQLEQAAINSLRQWRFEPLQSDQNVKEQYAIIVFPFRLK